eukprot:763602-Hanusia_phi.AAC.2
METEDEVSGGDKEVSPPPRVEDDQRAGMPSSCPLRASDRELLLAALRAAEKRAEKLSGKPKWFKMR